MSPPDEERDASELIRRANVLLPGVYAWAATVLYPALLHGVGGPARFVAFFAPVPLLVGLSLAHARPALARALALNAFVGSCLLTWILLGDLLAVDRLDPIRAALGGFGWVLFAFAWGASREPKRVPEDDPRALHGDALTPRGTLAPGASGVLTVALVGAALPLVLAWRVTRPPHALLAHAVAVAAAVALVSSGAEVATQRGKWAPIEPSSRRLASASVSLAALGVLIIVGAVALLTT
jgi:hypothetical protein